MLLTGLQPGGKASKLLKQEKNQTKPKPKKTTQTKKNPKQAKCPALPKKKAPNTKQTQNLNPRSKSKAKKPLILSPKAIV